MRAAHFAFPLFARTMGLYLRNSLHLKLETRNSKLHQELMSTTSTRVAGDVANLALADMGKKRIDWANQSMKVLQIIRKDFIKNQPLQGIRISACLHVTAETRPIQPSEVSKIKPPSRNIVLE